MFLRWFYKGSAYQIIKTDTINYLKAEGLVEELIIKREVSQMRNTARYSLTGIILVLAFIVLILNLIWEFSHYKLYIDLTGIPSTLHLIIASFADLFLIAFIFLSISLFRKTINWIEKPKKLDYFIITLLGLLIAIAIEIYSLSKRRWAYTELMPTILGIGLSPLIQLFTSAILSLIIFRTINKHFNL